MTREHKAMYSAAIAFLKLKNYLNKAAVPQRS